MDVSSTCDEVLKLMGFDSDYVFIRSGHFFTTGLDNRTTITISELHKLQDKALTPKIETDRAGKQLDDLWLVSRPPSQHALGDVS